MLAVEEIENKRIAQEYKELLRLSYQKLTPEDKKLIRLAFDTAVEAHKDQRRHSGEPYVLHPIAVAKIVASEMGMDTVSIASALLHDVVEDTQFTIADMRRLFGRTIAKIIEGLTKISNLPKNKAESTQTENFKKILLTITEDPRVIIIKIADRLHNMLTLESMPLHKQERIASETLYIYAPIAYRLGLYNIKNELEDLGLKYTDPRAYNHIRNKIEETKEDQIRYIDDFIGSIESQLNTVKPKLNYDIKGRLKTIFSIYQKMNRQGVPFEDVFDKFAIRIVYKCPERIEKDMAFKIYGAITNHFIPNPLRIRDWITSPKSTGYEALHITVMGPGGRWVEVQIRSHRMDEIAEKGYAAHFRYKHGTAFKLFDNWLDHIKTVIENNKDNAVNLIQEFRMDLYENEIFVYTPKGDVISLPEGASPLDFAFMIHTEIGLHTKAAKVNKKLVPINYTLRAGDQVEIITSPEVLPRFDWLQYAKISRSKSAIQASLKEQEQLTFQRGKNMLQRKLKALKVNLDQKVTDQMIKYFKLRSSKELYYNVYERIIDNAMLRDYASNANGSFLSNIRHQLVKYRNNRRQDHLLLKELPEMPLLFGKNEEKLPYSLASCCSPIPGDDIFGFTGDNEITVHKKNCKNAVALQANYNYRIVSAKWPEAITQSFSANLRLSGIDDVGLVSKVLTVISDNMHCNIKSISFAAEYNYFKGEVIVDVKNHDTIKKLIKELKRIKGIESVTRY